VEHFDSRGSFTEVISKRLLLNHQLGFFELGHTTVLVSLYLRDQRNGIF
jgi:hypothetical protein